MVKRDIVVIAHNIRSIHNVGSFFRTCDGFSISHLYLTGYTPYPEVPHDDRPPHVRLRLTQQIHKTALGAEMTVSFSHTEDPRDAIAQLKAKGYLILALEQTNSSAMLPLFTTAAPKVALLLGEEVHGIPDYLLALTHKAIEIPMDGAKESFNVSIACGIALYHLRYLI
jgi:23S rRNA (guanosine2251-2'-O)-methyltransferase